MKQKILQKMLHKETVFSATVQVSDCNTFPLMVSGDFKATLTDEGYSFDLLRITLVELHVGAGKGSIDVTANVLASTVMKQVIEAHVALQETELYNQMGGEVL